MAKSHAKTAGNTPFEHWCCSKGANRMKLPGDMQTVKICPLFCWKLQQSPWWFFSYRLQNVRKGAKLSLIWHSRIVTSIFPEHKKKATAQRTQACLVPALGISCLQQLTLHSTAGSRGANLLTLTCKKQTFIQINIFTRHLLLGFHQEIDKLHQQLFNSNMHMPYLCILVSATVRSCNCFRF